MRMTHFEREVIDRLGRIEEQNKTQFKRLEAVERAINGNGHPGLAQRVQVLEDINRTRKESKTGVLAWLAIAISAVSAAVNYFKGH